jgi:probable rRNA maturation factor
MTDPIGFCSEETDFVIGESDLVRVWVNQIVRKYKHRIQQVDYIFCSDEFLLKINQDYLKHDFYTDIITFPFHLTGSKDLHADIYISIDRVKENAETHKVSFIDELHRVMIHGILHMVGFSDKDDKSTIEMRKAENLALSLRMF